jgi:hypothetical protein
MIQSMLEVYRGAKACAITSARRFRGRGCRPAHALSSYPPGPEVIRGGAGFSQFAEAERIVTLCEPYTSVVCHQWRVKERRDLNSKRAIEESLTGGGNKQVGSADDLRDSHGRVIRDHGELIGWNIVVSPDDEVSEILSSVELLWAEAAIVEADDLAVRNLEAPTEWHRRKCGA